MHGGEHASTCIQAYEHDNHVSLPTVIYHSLYEDDTFAHEDEDSNDDDINDDNDSDVDNK